MRRALVVGRAKSVWDDYATARALCDFDDVIVVGRLCQDFPDPIDHLVSFHVRLFDKWMRKRRSNGYPDPRQYWGAFYKGRDLTVDKRTGKRLTSMEVSTIKCDGGSSGLVAVIVAREGLDPPADKVVLAGVPMTKDGGHYDDDKSWKEADNYWTTWRERYNDIAPYVRSVSGRTRETFGYPTKEWLDADGS